MSASKQQNTRRAFLTQGGVALGAGVAATAGATALTSDVAPTSHNELEQLRRQLADARDREAIRELQRTFLSTVGRPHPLHEPFRRSYRPNPSRPEALMLSADGLQAAGTLYVDVEVCTPVQGDSTVATMARLQGNVADLRWEAGQLDATYSKTAGRWQITTLAYTRHHTVGDTHHG